MIPACVASGATISVDTDESTHQPGARQRHGTCWHDAVAVRRSTLRVARPPGCHQTAMWRRRIKRYKVRDIHVAGATEAVLSTVDSSEQRLTALDHLWAAAVLPSSACPPHVDEAIRHHVAADHATASARSSPIVASSSTPTGTPVRLSIPPSSLARAGMSVFILVVVTTAILARLDGDHDAILADGTANTCSSAYLSRCP